MTPGPEENTGEPGASEVVDAETAPAAEPDATEEAPEATVESDLTALIEEARSQRDEYLELAQRTKADFDNYRKRMATEGQAQVERGRIEVASGLIEAIDNLERVLEAVGTELPAAQSGEIPTEAPVAEQGVIVAYRDLRAVLQRAGIESFDSEGEAFDPNFHEALQALPAEGVEAGLVIEEMQKGYRNGEQVIRHARVVVSQ